ncbi:MAG: DUF1552 domain-containing protein [Myxococcota bacterium]
MSRRTVLRGAGGAALALPFLEIMSERQANAAPGDIPCRYLVAVAGSSLGSGNTDINETYVPDAEGFGYDLKTALAPFAGGMLPSGRTYANVRDEISVVTELKIPWAAENGGSVPAGGRPDNHHETMVSPLLSGVRTPEGQNTKAFGPTSDQVVADAIGGDTLFPSLQYCVQPSTYLGSGGLSSRAVISYTDGGGIGARAMPVNPQKSPREAWRELFFNFSPEDPAEAADRDFERRLRQGILDVVRTQTETLERRLGRADRIRLEQHFDEIRDLEQRLIMLGPETVGACMGLADPGEDPAEGGNRPKVGDRYPYQVNSGYSNEDLRAEIFNGMVKMAFACDLTRSIAMQYTHFHSWMNMYELIGRESDLHELGHSRHASEGQAEGLAWHYKHFASLVDDLRNTNEVDGTRLIDHCALVMTHEGGYGLDPSDGSTKRSHSTERMACLIAGRAGGMMQGQHIKRRGAHPAQVLISAMNAVGIEGEELGEVSGVIPELFGRS